MTTPEPHEIDLFNIRANLIRTDRILVYKQKFPFTGFLAVQCFQEDLFHLQKCQSE
jgi:hypothetical protein